MKSSTIPVLVEITFVLSTPAQVPGTGLRTKKAHLPSMDALGGCVTCAILPVAVAGSTCTMVLIVACMISIASLLRTEYQVIYFTLLSTKTLHVAESNKII